MNLSLFKHWQPQAPRKPPLWMFWIAAAMVHLPAWVSFSGEALAPATSMTDTLMLAAMLHMAGNMDLLGGIEINAAASIVSRNLSHLASGVAATLLGPCAIVIVHTLSVLGVLAFGRWSYRAELESKPSRRAPPGG